MNNKSLQQSKDTTWGDMAVDGKKILKQILKEQGVTMWTGCN
jgi:hypothetical protein